MISCDWLDVHELTEYYTLMNFFKTVKWGTPRSQRDQIEVGENWIISTNNPRLLLTANSYRFKAVNYWNNLPEHLREEPSMGKFKVGIKRWIKDRRLDPDLDPEPDLDQE